MRILIVLDYFYSPSMPVGGAERQALKLSQRLIKKGVNVRVVTGQWDWRQPRYEEIGTIPVHRHFTGWVMFGMRGFRRLSQYLYLITLFTFLVRHRNQYDLIHCQSAMFGASMVVLAGRLLNKRTLVRAMASGPWGDVARFLEGEEGTIWGNRWMLGHMKEADCIVVLNQQVRDEMIQIGVQPEKIIHIPNGVDVEQILPKTDYRLDHEIRLIFVGRLHPQKGVDILLSAFQQLQNELPQYSWQLKLIGTGFQRAGLEALARQLSIDRVVQFIGQVDNPLPYLSQGDIFVLPSRSEGISNALLEAMAVGLPCIVTDIPGNNDVVIPRKNGLLVRCDDPEDLAQAITSLVMDQALRKMLGQEALRTVKVQYAIDSIADKYLDLYASLIQDGTEWQVSEISHG